LIANYNIRSYERIFYKNILFAGRTLNRKFVDPVLSETSLKLLRFFVCKNSNHSAMLESPNNPANRAFLISEGASNLILALGNEVPHK